MIDFNALTLLLIISDLLYELGSSLNHLGTIFNLSYLVPSYLNVSLTTNFPFSSLSDKSYEIV